MPSSVVIALSASLAILCYKLVNLIRYVRQARTTGLPYVITPVLETEVIGLIATPILRKAYNDYLNKDQGWPRWCRFMIKDWSWEDKRRAHDEYGDVFLCVSAEGIICYTADAAMGWDVMNRRNDFTKPRDKYKILEPYGPNVATAEGATYRFHVRVTAPPFGDGTGSRKEAFNEDEVLGNLFIYLLAGYETTANAISYGLACLALHQDIQDKVIEELDAVYASMEQSGLVELSYGVHFEQLRYMYGFMYEVLRLYPGVTLITKVALRPQTVSVTVPSSSTGTAATTTAHVLPAGTRVYMSAPGVHYHPRYWKDPTRLDPHRWTDSIWSHNKHDGEEPAKRRILAADKTRHMRGTLLTFSDGARACLGRKFAQAEFMGFFAALLRDYRIALAPEVDPIEVKRDLDRKSAGKITLAPLNSVKLKLEKRQVD
ncbi:hypothetical protein SLS56_008116 [Neofusicoccum ribis]|uniref:Cytochrome P450 n=1 Tax=Neofusicoccum ribis TaxID=45134 RepID=A0ABR3SL38_9PEZI